MDSNMKFTVSVNLQEKSSISAAIQIWGKSELKQRIVKFFVENSVFHSNEYQMNERWSDVTKLAVNELAKTDLTEEMTKDIRNRIDILGKKIYYWVRHMIVGVEMFELDLIRAIHWTVYGTIDESKTFESAWQKTNDNRSSAFPYACLFVQKEFIKQNINKMTIWIQSLFEPFRLKNSEYNVYTIVTMYICWRLGKNSIGGNKVYRNLRKLKYPAYELLRICLALGYVKPAKYFYSKLKKVEQPKILMEAAECALDQHKVDLGECRREKIAELLMFLINNMSQAVQINFITKNLTDVLKLILFLWPYQNLCWPILDFVWPKLSEADHETVLDLILSCLIKDSEKHCYINKKAQQDVLKSLLERLSNELVQKKFCQEKYWLQLFKLRDFTTLCLIISHSNLYRVRNDFIKMCYEDLKRYVSDGKFEIVDLYLSVLRLSDTEKDKFKQDFNLLPDFIDNGQFELADKFINWRCSSEEEKIHLKNEINPDVFFKKFTANKNENLANSFVNWYFNFTKEKNHVKEVLNKSLCAAFFTVWGKTCVCGSKFAEKKCLEFLKSFLKTDDEIKLFKKEAFEKNEQFVKLFCHHLTFVEGFDTLDELFRFCLIEVDEVKEIKRKIVDNIDWWIDEFAIKTSNFLMVSAVINWCVPNFVQRKNVIGKLFSSKRGATLCVAMLNNYKFEKDTPTLKLFNTWIKPYANISEIKQQLKSMKNGDITEKNILGVLSLLDSLEQEGKVTSCNITSAGFNNVK